MLRVPKDAMILYLVIGESTFTTPSSWGIVGIYKDYNKAWNCPLQYWTTRKVIEIETDLIDDPNDYSGACESKEMKRVVTVDPSYKV